MCGRFTLRAPIKEIVETFGLVEAPALTPRYNIAPTQQVAAIRLNPQAKGRKLDFLRWGLIPPWAGFPPIGYRMINARAETVLAKRAFYLAFQKRRCLVIADGFYEWKKPGNTKKPYFIRLKNDEPFAFAGIAEHWERREQSVESCAIITTKANELMATIHDRMPGILMPEDYDSWLDPDFQDQDKLLEMLRPYPAKEMIVYRVGNGVNDPTRESKKCLEMIA